MKEKLNRISNWLNDHHFPPRLTFFFLGIISTLWFLIRVIPKPSRAGYPCMKVAAPFMSGFVVYLLSVGGLTIVSRKARWKKFNVRYVSSLILIFGVIATLAVTPFDNTSFPLQDKAAKSGPDDGPNQPVGVATGINPGRVIWEWDPEATNADCINPYDLYKPENTNQSVVNRMVSNAVIKLTGKTNLQESWDALFHYFNYQKTKRNKGYTPGEKIFIKINQVTSNWKVNQEDRSGYYLPLSMTASEEAKKGMAGTCESYPHLVLEILRELVNVLGIDQKDIAVGDPGAHIFGHIYNIWVAEFPDVAYVDKSYANHGRTLIFPSKNDLIFYSDKSQSDKLYDIIENADYLINVANLKPHGRNGITLTAKNHFGSQARKGAWHLHYSLISPITGFKPTNAGYHKYRVLVDMMGSKYLGKNTLLYVVDGLFGGGAVETSRPVNYFMSPFNNDWSNSIFISQDQVALESVCYDFLRTEWNGTYNHHPANNSNGFMVNVNGVDDYLHQAAEPDNWPAGILYDPDSSGVPLSSLGTHEHWNNAKDKQYSRNLGLSKGIELISIPDTLVKTKASVSNNNITIRSFNEVFATKTFYSALADDDKTKWVLTRSENSEKLNKNGNNSFSTGRSRLKEFNHGRFHTTIKN